MTKKSDAPAIRFKGFSDAWEQRKLSEMCGTFEYGLNAAAKEFDGKNKYIRITDIDDASREFLLSDLSSPDICPDGMSKYLLSSGDIVFARTGASVGKTYIYRENDGIVYFAGFLIRAKVNQDNDAEFVFQSTLSPSYEKYIRITSQRSGQPGVNAQEYGEYDLFAPSKEEQQRIGQFLRGIDHLITLHQRKFEKLTNVKKSMLEKMFPQNGSRYPEIRFKGFTDPWEQRKFSELVQIERGGSPRPIDDFITDAPNGLNWVKIGDAPTQGNYITKTAEKIRPEGLSKTREVHPGDLILSNSMSFGKPYIMGIDGCIHDGWLLIRNTYGVFDLTFLCHLLGTPQMLGQYRSLAAGSTVNNLNKELVGNTVVTIPSITEQRVLGDYLEQLDHLITLHQRELEKLQNIKKSMLEKMFV